MAVVNNKINKNVPKMPSSNAASGKRSSVPSGGYSPDIYKALDTYKKIKPAWFLPLIPVIRRLVESNFDFGQAISNIVNLGNTGHDVYFDPGVTDEQVELMRKHLFLKQRQWGKNLPHIHGVINRTFTQAFISGAISAEWVVNESMTGVDEIVLVNPEEIEFRLKPNGIDYDIYQRPSRNGFRDTTSPDVVKLNPYTYRYFALNGDGDSPYGCPPYLTALRTTVSQNKMLENIDFVTDQLGIMGFLSLLMETPEVLENEDDTTYYARLENYLETAKNRIMAGVKDGVVVGWKDSHELDFNSISKDFQGVTKIFENNELLTASGLKTDASMLGRGYSTSETQITIVFTKLLSELKNAQIAQAAHLEFGYTLELTLAGFKFDYLTVEFKRSTLQDELKYQQAQEYKIRNLRQLRMDGIISQSQYANELQYKKPYMEEPLVPFEDQLGINDTPKDPDGKLKKKNESEKKTYSKKKSQGVVKKQKS